MQYKIDTTILPTLSKRGEENGPASFGAAYQEVIIENKTKGVITFDFDKVTLAETSDVLEFFQNRNKPFTELKKEFEGKNTLNAAILEWLVQNKNLIPNWWAKRRIDSNLQDYWHERDIVFLDTVFALEHEAYARWNTPKSIGEHYVKCLSHHYHCGWGIVKRQLKTVNFLRESVILLEP